MLAVAGRRRYSDFSPLRHRRASYETIDNFNYSFNKCIRRNHDNRRTYLPDEADELIILPALRRSVRERSGLIHHRGIYQRNLRFVLEGELASFPFGRDEHDCNGAVSGCRPVDGPAGYGLHVRQLRSGEVQSAELVHLHGRWNQLIRPIPNNLHHEQNEQYSRRLHSDRSARHSVQPSCQRNATREFAHSALNVLTKLSLFAVKNITMRLHRLREVVPTPGAPAASAETVHDSRMRRLRRNHDLRFHCSVGAVLDWRPTLSGQRREW